jgi:hypothetical protein
MSHRPDRDRDPVRDRDRERDRARRERDMRDPVRDRPERETARLNEYFVSGEGIHREVMQREICKYLGPEAYSRPGNHNVGLSAVRTCNGVANPTPGDQRLYRNCRAAIHPSELSSSPDGVSG